MYTLLIIIVTAIISIAAFSSSSLIDKLILWPSRMNNPVQYYRFISHGFIHADWGHLFFNMFALYFFGTITENQFASEGMGGIVYIIFYLSAIVIAALPSYIKRRKNYYYRSLGASGGVAAVLFATVYFTPLSKIFIMFIPIGIPSVIFGVAYLVYSAYMSKRGGTNVNHDAHFWGSVYGFLIAWLIDPTHRQFIDQLMNRQ